MKAPRQPNRLCMNSMPPGVAALPSMPGEGVHRIGLAHALGRDVARQQRVVGRVVDRVAEPHAAPNIAISTQNEWTSAATAKADGAEQEARDQHEPRVDAVDQEAGRRLQHRRHRH